METRLFSPFFFFLSSFLPLVGREEECFLAPRCEIEHCQGRGSKSGHWLQQISISEQAEVDGDLWQPHPQPESGVVEDCLR